MSIKPKQKASEDNDDLQLKEQNSSIRKCDDRVLTVYSYNKQSGKYLLGKVDGADVWNAIIIFMRTLLISFYITELLCVHIMC